MEYIIETEGLTKRYGKRLCVNNISIHIAKGDIYGFMEIESIKGKHQMQELSRHV